MKVAFKAHPHTQTHSQLSKNLFTLLDLNLYTLVTVVTSDKFCCMKRFAATKQFERSLDTLGNCMLALKPN